MLETEELWITVGLHFLSARTRTLVGVVVTSFLTVHHIAISMAVLNTLKFPQFTRIRMIFCQLSNRPTSLMSIFSI